MGVVNYLIADGEILSENRSGVISDYLPDALGSTIALTNDLQQQTDTFVYWPYGETRAHTGSNPTPYTFCGTLGYSSDISSNFTYVRARELRLGLARWLTVDPLWPGLRLAYSYANASPINRADPLGLFTTWDVANVLASCGSGLGFTFLGGIVGGGSRTDSWNGAKCNALLNCAASIITMFVGLIGSEIEGLSDCIGGGVAGALASVLGSYLCSSSPPPLQCVVIQAVIAAVKGCAGAILGNVSKVKDNTTKWINSIFSQEQSAVSSLLGGIIGDTSICNPPPTSCGGSAAASSSTGSGTGSSGGTGGLTSFPP